jgi:hypothetical protein
LGVAQAPGFPLYLSLVTSQKDAAAIPNAMTAQQSNMIQTQ